MVETSSEKKTAKRQKEKKHNEGKKNGNGFLQLQEKPFFKTKRNFLVAYFSASSKTNPSNVRLVLRKGTKNKEHLLSKGV